MSIAWDCFLRTSDWVAHPIQAARSMDERRKKRKFLARISAVSSLRVQFIRVVKNYQEKGIRYGEEWIKGVQWAAKLRVRITRTKRVMKENLKSLCQKKYRTERRTRA
jgi:hypothetical protein